MPPLHASTITLFSTRVAGFSYPDLVPHISEALHFKNRLDGTPDVHHTFPLCHIDYGDISPVSLVDAAKRLQAGQHVKAVARLKQKEGVG